jgi:hypothetical protein
MTMAKMQGHKAHHHGFKKADGGRAVDDKSPTEVYEGKGSNVEKEAEGARRKDGGRAEHEKHEHEKHKGRKARKDGGRVEGKKAHHHIHRGRMRGGRAGADMNPLSTAAHGTDAEGHKTTSSEGH